MFVYLLRDLIIGDYLLANELIIFNEFVLHKTLDFVSNDLYIAEPPMYILFYSIYKRMLAIHKKYDWHGFCLYYM